MSREPRQQERLDSAKRASSLALNVVVVALERTPWHIALVHTLLMALNDADQLVYVLRLIDTAPSPAVLDSLSAQLGRPIHTAENSVALEPQQVYVLPQSKLTSIKGDQLRSVDHELAPTPLVALDYFLRALAVERHDQAICLWLAASEQALGLQAISQRGGLVLAPAEQDDVAALAHSIHQHFAAVLQQQQTLGALTSAAEAADLDAILSLVYAQTKHDFRAYKHSTLLRRIERRMSLQNIKHSQDYLAFLQQHPPEVLHLFRDLLISVTHFFRDPQAFAVLETDVLPQLVANHAPDKPVRVWVPGCATGEEVYSLAILIQEALERAQKPCPIQLFATDIDQSALDVARSGIYTANSVANVSPERLERCFTYEHEQYKVIKAIRDMIVFANQDLTRDPPFSHLDLISCRNVLIYLDTVVQKRVIALFHFALNANGYLFLGNAETVSTQEHLFTPISKKWHLYQRQNTARHSVTPFPAYPEPGGLRPQPSQPPQPSYKAPLQQMVQQFLLTTYAPTTVMINCQYDCLYIQNPGQNQPYLQIPSGEPTRNLLMLLHEDLRIPVRTAVLRVQREQHESTVGVNWHHGDSISEVLITARPFPLNDDGDTVLITIAEQHTRVRPAPESRPEIEQHLVQQLEYELAATRADLQQSIADLEASNEELKAANEEMMSMNEEFQSTNEELETSKEELHSLNEELITINSQLQDKVVELEATSNDLTNLLSSTDIATLFLDEQFCIKRFTPATNQLFSLIPSDVGRPISDIVRKFNDPQLLDDATRVLETLQPQMREIIGEGERWYIRRILPYRTLDNRIEGVVITFTEATKLKQAEAALQLSEERFRTALSNSPIWVFNQDRSLRYSWSYNALLRLSERSIIGRHDEELFERHEDALVLTELKQLVLNNGSGLREEVQLLVEGSERFVDMTIEPLQDSRQAIIGITGSITDVTPRKHAESELARLLSSEKTARAGAEQAVKLRDTFLSVASHELKTPLTVLLGNVQAVQRRSEANKHLSERDLRAIRLIENQALRLNDLINLLLDVSRIETGQLMIRSERFDLKALLERVIAQYQPTQSNYTLSVRIGERPLEINGDELRIEQVLHNLLHNAFKYSPRGGRIDVDLESYAPTACVSVRDQGIGIPLSAQSAIFERFYRASNAEAAHIGGMGVGLYVVKEIVQLHGGTISVTSELGVGSVFTVCLPLAHQETT